MLQNELIKVADWVAQLQRSFKREEGTSSAPAADLEPILRELLEEIASKWAKTVFSNANGEQLRRYFKYHLDHLLMYCQVLHQLIVSNPDRISLVEQALSLQSLCCRLISQLERFYPEYFSWELPAPCVYHSFRIRELFSLMASVRKGLETAVMSLPLKNALIGYIQEMGNTGDNHTFSFGALAYFDRFLQELTSICFDDSLQVASCLGEKLRKLNFNHLEFVLSLQDQLNTQLMDHNPDDQLQLLRRQRLIMNYTTGNGLIYDACFPSIAAFMQGWLSEEIAWREQELQRESAVSIEQPEKVALQLSVAQMACLIWLFFRENIYTEGNLRQIFKFMAKHYRTKRQPWISWESLSKEYYSLGQFTAAEIRDLLRRMISRINDEFFPV